MMLGWGGFMACQTPGQRQEFWWKQGRDHETLGMKGRIDLSPYRVFWKQSEKSQRGEKIISVH